ncbi:MAG: Mannitol-phosphate 5-dehydrogenase [Thermoproteota archaeon]|nr:Mannitol-phosphate 5-dehydrogenase [Thermoproteota archaeon]
MKIVLFGAGKIGRSLVGKIFSSAGHEVVFVDVIDDVINALNEKHRYKVEIREAKLETIMIENVRAVNSKNSEQVASEIATADLVATCVGVNNLPNVYSNIAMGLLKRSAMRKGPLDIIIFENLRNSSAIFRPGLKQCLPVDYPMDSLVGLVETSTDKMAVDTPIGIKEQDPLTAYTEAFETVYVDKKAFKGTIPEVRNLIPTEDLGAYFDRKFFTLNMGHAITAYLGYLLGISTIWEAIDNNYIRKIVESSMQESGQALIKEYPKEFGESNHQEYIAGLIRRFGNPALGDTVFRVGRDVPRKLSRNDRLIGALLLDMKYNINAPSIILGVAAAMLFRAKDEKGELSNEDKHFQDESYSKGVFYVLTNICQLNVNNPKEDQVITEIKRVHDSLVKNPKNWA